MKRVYFITSSWKLKAFNCGHRVHTEKKRKPKIMIEMENKSELLEALISAIETIEWMNGCSSPNKDEVEEAIMDGRAVIARFSKG